MTAEAETETEAEVETEAGAEVEAGACAPDAVEVRGDLASCSPKRWP